MRMIRLKYLNQNFLLHSMDSYNYWYSLVHYFWNNFEYYIKASQNNYGVEIDVTHPEQQLFHSAFKERAWEPKPLQGGISTQNLRS